MSSRWLVGRLAFGSWVRVSGVVDAEWEYLQGYVKESTTTELLSAFIKQGMTFVDVGANVGYFTLLAASLGARVVAYEPTPAVYKRLRENVELNGLQNVSLLNAAVAEKAGTLTFHQSPDDPEANSIFGEGECIEVEAVALDEDLSRRSIQHVDLLKIDAEGAEPLVLAGAAKLMRSERPPVMVIEVNPYCLRNAGSSVEALLELIKASGYRCSEIEIASYRGERVANVLAVPPGFDAATAGIALPTDAEVQSRVTAEA